MWSMQHSCMICLLCKSDLLVVGKLFIGFGCSWWFYLISSCLCLAAWWWFLVVGLLDRLNACLLGRFW